MELSDRQLEEIRKAARKIDYGSVTINISATSNKLDLSINKRIRFEEDKLQESRLQGEQ
ncbi:MAG: hypothetical protein FWG77_10750 [Treponema sp.]|nr:hypothetical protein [Treponema sp.]